MVWVPPGSHRGDDIAGYSDWLLLSLLWTEMFSWTRASRIFSLKWNRHEKHLYWPWHRCVPTPHKCPPHFMDMEPWTEQPVPVLVYNLLFLTWPLAEFVSWSQPLIKDPQESETLVSTESSRDSEQRDSQLWICVMFSSEFDSSSSHSHTSPSSSSSISSSRGENFCPRHPEQRQTRQLLGLAYLLLNLISNNTLETVTKHSEHRPAPDFTKYCDTPVLECIYRQ